MIVRRLKGLARTPETFGVVHGDFELDNLCWEEGRAVAFDFDGAERSWFVADVVYAIRDLQPAPPGNPRPGEAELFGAFLRGYRREHPLAEADLALLPLFAAAHAARSAARLRTALGVQESDAPSWETWEIRLRRKLAENVVRQRRLVLAVTAGLGSADGGSSKATTLSEC